MTEPAAKKLWKNEYFQTAIMILAIVGLVFGFWYGSRLVLNTDYPMLAVASGSMCMLPGPSCDGWSHPFERTLHVGDLIIVQGVTPEDIHAAPFPDGDIIVFRQYTGSELIVHRAIEKQMQGNVTYFVTKGDGNSAADSPISADHVIGRVVMRIPWIGHFALYMRDSGLLVIVILIIILIIAEFVLPLLTSKKSKPDQNVTVQKAPEPQEPTENQS